MVSTLWLALLPCLHKVVGRIARDCDLQGLCAVCVVVCALCWWSWITFCIIDLCCLRWKVMHEQNFPWFLWRWLCLLVTMWTPEAATSQSTYVYISITIPHFHCNCSFVFTNKYKRHIIVSSEESFFGLFSHSYTISLLTLLPKSTIAKFRCMPLRSR